MREHELPGVPVVNAGGRCVGIITEADLVMAGENADLHLPHYFELFGGFVFLEPLEPLRGPPAQGDRRARQRSDDRGPGHDRAEATVRRGRAADLALQAQPPAGGRARAARRRR